jgi:hypothetical protein
MTPLSHADAHERLADLALEPGALDDLGNPATDALAAHVATCAMCRREVDAWRRTQAALEVAKGEGVDRLDLADLAHDESVPLPPALRGTILEAVEGSAQTGDQGGRALVAVTAGQRPARTSGRGPVARNRLLALVAVLAIVMTGAGLLVSQAVRLDRAREETAALEAVAVTVDRVLRDPNHRVVDLVGADGTVRGSLSWSRHDLVVLTTALDPPPPDRVYRCWIERDGERSPVGKMWFAGGTAFWNGTLDQWATTSLEAGGTFGVSLEPIERSVGNPAVLVADLGG